MSFKEFAYQKLPNPLSKKSHSSSIKVGDLCKYYSKTNGHNVYVRVRRIVYNYYRKDNEIWGVYTYNEDGLIPYVRDFDTTEKWMPEKELTIVEEPY